MTVLSILFMIIADILILIKGFKIMDDGEEKTAKGMIIVIAAVFFLTILLGLFLAFLAKAYVESALSSCDSCVTGIGAMG